MNAGDSAILRGGGWWSGHWPGFQSVARSSCDTTSVPATSWGYFSWHVLYSGSAAGHGLSVIEIVSKYEGMWKIYDKAPGRRGRPLRARFFHHVQRATVPVVCTLVFDGGMPGKVRPVGDDMGKR
jgi:hypothetical protein